METSGRIRNILFIFAAAVICFVVIITGLLVEMGVFERTTPLLMREQEPMPAQSTIPLIRQYEDALETVRVRATNFSLKRIPGYDKILEGNTKLNLATNRALYKAAFGDDYLYLPMSKVPEGDVFMQKDGDYMFVVDPDVAQKPAEAVEMINEAMARNPQLTGYVYLGVPYWLTPLIREQDDKFDEPVVSMADALNGLNPAIERNCLDVSDMQTYHEFFYNSDHHWTVEGAYRGYEQIYQMLKNKHPDLSPMVTRDSANEYRWQDFRGMLALVSAYDGAKDSISDGGLSEMAPHKITMHGVSGKIWEYESMVDYRDQWFDEHKMTPSKYQDLYRVFWMPTETYIWFDFPENNTNRRLLILGDSLRKPIVEPIASHFDVTHVVDVRFERDFRFDDFVRENEITDVLFLYGSTFNQLYDNYAVCFKESA